MEFLRVALAKVERVTGVTFDWKRSEHPELNLDDGGQIGPIAQEMEKRVPEAVSKAADGTYRIAYGSLLPVLIEAIKEQQAHIDELRKQLASMAAERNGR